PKRPWRIVVAYVLCPALLLCPDPAKGITGPDTVDEIISLVPSIQVERFPGAGHCIRRDQPAQYERVVREFLARA
ncbi:MAG: alpha/beta hydrolase, partial [Anaerolineae bacterium]|nr:alpha/beta hydrolase [Anaerolineae bacterium]